MYIRAAPNPTPPASSVTSLFISFAPSVVVSAWPRRAAFVRPTRALESGR